MVCLRLILCLVRVIPTLAVRVDMQGSIQLGRDVVNTLDHLMKRNFYSRRSGSKPDLEDNNEAISLLVDSASLCRDVDFCKDHQIVNEYIISLANTIENIFKGLTEKSNTDHNPQSIIFEEELKNVLEEVKILLKNANNTPGIKKDGYNWLDFIKKTNAKFLERTIAFASQRVEGSPKEITEVKKKLAQRVTVALSEVEIEYERKLCSEQNICTTSYECTKALDTLLKGISNLTENKTKEFVRFFSEALPDTGFYELLSEVTAQEFQAILNDMSYAQNIPTKNVLSIVHKSVKDRVDFVKENTVVTGGSDVKILHVILSDMDHFYDKLVEPFRQFLKSFRVWSEKDGARFSGPFRKIMSEILKKLSIQSEQLLWKLRNEVTVFLEITVDPVG